MHTVTLARGITATREYNFIGDLTQISFSGGTPQVSYSAYNRAGLPCTINDGGETHALLYDAANRLISDKITSGTWSGITVSNRFNPAGREAIALLQNATQLAETKYGYDAYGRMGSVTSGVETVFYAYKPASDRLQSTTFKHNGTTVLTTTRSWDPAQRLQSIANSVGTGSTPSVTSHQYLYDSVNRRTQATREDSSIWSYGYNDRDEVSSGKHYWSDWAPVSGQQFEYTYDNIGNRVTASFGGDVSGLNLRSGSYTADAQNQYTSITTPNYEDIVGAALATNSVTVRVRSGSDLNN